MESLPSLGQGFTKTEMGDWDLAGVMPVLGVKFSDMMNPEFGC